MITKRWSVLWAPACLLIILGGLTTRADESSEGVAVVTDSPPAGDAAAPPASEAWEGGSCPTCPEGTIVRYGPEYRMTGNRLFDWWQEQSMRYRARNMQQSLTLRAAMGDRSLERRSWWDSQVWAFRTRNREKSDQLRSHLRCKFGYFVPTGCGGAGCPPFGLYHRAYAALPEYLDGRDAKLYAAQGYGVPMAVPLAPNVWYTYNYGWGVPSSRLTPVFRVPPQP